MINSTIWHENAYDSDMGGVSIPIRDDMEHKYQVPCTPVSVVKRLTAPVPLRISERWGAGATC